VHPSLKRVLIVEDDDALRTALVRLFVRSGVDTLHARTAQRACELLREERTELIIADVRLQDSTVFELLDVARELSPAPAVIAISGKASPDEAFRLAQKGVRGYLAKPFTLSALREEVESAFSEGPDLEPLIAATVGRVPLRRVQSDVRRVMVKEALARADGNRSAAARLLQVTRQAIQQSLRATEKDLRSPAGGGPATSPSQD